MAQPEEIITKPTSPKGDKTPIETTTNTAHMIKQEIDSLEQDIKQNEQILSWLNKVADSSNISKKRKKRGLGGGFGGGPPIYNRRLPSSQMGPYMPQTPVLPGPRQGIRYPNYDYDYDIGPPYGQMGPAQLTPPKDLPENVEDALGTINDYLANFVN